MPRTNQIMTCRAARWSGRTGSPVQFTVTCGILAAGLTIAVAAESGPMNRSPDPAPASGCTRQPRHATAISWRAVRSTALLTSYNQMV